LFGERHWWRGQVAEMGGELGDTIGVDVVDACDAEFGPEPFSVGRAPEADAAALGMGATDELMEFETIGIGEAWA
jgi:hypothetical protein